MAGQDWFEKDFYADLGLAPEADAAAVKKAYRKLARAHHPDSPTGDETRFKEIGEAYSVLSDPEQRQQYDAIRTMSRGGPRFAPGGSSGSGGFEDLLGGLFNGAPGRGARPGRPSQGFGGGQAYGGGPFTGEADLEDLFRSMGGSFTGSPRSPEPGPDLTAHSSISFRDARAGRKMSISAPGQGSLTVRIPAGVRDGQRIRLRGKGSPSTSGGRPGDLLLTVKVEADPIFSRSGDDLLVTAPVTFAEAALGATIEVPALARDAAMTSVRLKIAPGTPSGRTLRVKGRGLPQGKGFGDLRVMVQVAVPQRLTDQARAAVLAYAEATVDEDPRAELLADVRQAQRAPS
ncbi:MAG: DnaJ C-terminal domain-containing protein [Angustibacter sp.]